MSGSKDLDFLLREANPVLDPERYVFVCRQASYGDHQEWQPIATFAEEEGLTFVLRQEIADRDGLSYDGVFKRITLQVHSSLEAVGLTARFSACLAAEQISANVFAGFYHDHIFVAEADGEKAMDALRRLSQTGAGSRNQDHRDSERAKSTEVEDLILFKSEEQLAGFRDALQNKWYSRLSTWWIYISLLIVVGEFAGLWQLTTMNKIVLFSPILPILLYPPVMAKLATSTTKQDPDREV